MALPNCMLRTMSLSKPKKQRPAVPVGSYQSWCTKLQHSIQLSNLGLIGRWQSDWFVKHGFDLQDEYATLTKYIGDLDV